MVPGEMSLDIRKGRWIGSPCNPSRRWPRRSKMQWSGFARKGASPCQCSEDCSLGRGIGLFRPRTHRAGYGISHRDATDARDLCRVDTPRHDVRIVVESEPGWTPPAAPVRKIQGWGRPGQLCWTAFWRGPPVLMRRPMWSIMSRTRMSFIATGIQSNWRDRQEISTLVSWQKRRVASGPRHDASKSRAEILSVNWLGCRSNRTMPDDVKAIVLKR